MPFTEILASGTVITDGAWGTELQQRGLPLNACPDLWNLKEPDAVKAVAAAYAGAGAQVVLTNTFRANPISLAGYGMDSETYWINRTGVELSREAAGDRARVFASIGPSGKLLALGDITEADLHHAFEKQVEGLAAGSPDALLVETMSDVEEALIALRAARQTGLPVIVSFAFDTGRNRDRTMTGLTPEQAAKAAEAGGASAVGANCGNGIELFPGICKRMRAATGLPLWMKANAGLPEVVDDKAIYQTSPEDFASHLPALLDAGASFVGGCCGTSPAFVRALVKRMEELRCASA